MFTWQLTHPRPSTYLTFEPLSRPYGRVGCRVSTWHCWHSRGLAAFSMRSWLLPCGSWQVVQLSVTGACSHRNGPRFSAWQVKQESLSDCSLSRAGVMLPCGLWHDVHVILPSRTGMCEERYCWAR